ncbi:DUF6545 domain-containing protein [Streptomyces capitiformicae]|uniref:DUF6545 domain-containing protein n=1 Tax=Streptomyces capitiformicae TaxID=2014920 RepID=A0A919GQR6_9ACTN|nr:DUF6545 domain-containing protein [Streptomyces capitiformicae]GHH89225.1 hypothetical protein GCM10017771_38670 [Streptomyces capitiformicae]
MEPIDIADQLGLWSILTLWAALVWRARPALCLRCQRGLWLTVLATAVATSLFQPAIVALATDLGGDTRTIVLARNLIGVLSAGLVLLFVIDSTHGHGPHLAVMVGMAAAMGSLLLLGLSEGAPADAPSVQRPAAPSTPYVLILVVSHLAGDIAAAAVCRKYDRRSNDRELVWSLRLFAMGSCLAIVFWSGYLIHHYVPAPGGMAGLSVVISVHGFFRAASLLVPTAFTLARAVESLRILWVLWPMWHDLTGAVPQVVLVQPQKTRIRQVLRSRGPLALQAHRQTIETYDAILELQRYTPSGAYEEASERAQDAGIGSDRLAAAALAGALGEARRGKLGGAAPAAAPCPLPGLEQGTLATLLVIAGVWPSMADAVTERPRSSSARRP